MYLFCFFEYPFVSYLDLLLWFLPLYFPAQHLRLYPPLEIPEDVQQHQYLRPPAILTLYEPLLKPGKEAALDIS